MDNFLYKVGDKVTVRKNLPLEPDNWREIIFKMRGGSGKNTGTCMGPIMRSFSGKVVTISKIIFDTYYVEEDPHHFCWTDEMFEETFRPQSCVQFNSLL